MNGDCIYSKVCTLTDTDKCGMDCFRYNQMKKLLDYSNLPKHLQTTFNMVAPTEDVQAWEKLRKYKNNILKNVQQGKNLYIYSPFCGNGKTTWGVRMLLSYLNEVWSQPVLRPRAIYMPVSELFDRERETIEHPDDSYFTLRTELFRADLVVWDDLGSTRVTDFNALTLLNIIDTREARGLSNVYTSNIGGAKVSELYGVRLGSRIWENSYKVKFSSRVDRRTVVDEC